MPWNPDTNAQEWAEEIAYTGEFVVEPNQYEILFSTFIYFFFAGLVDKTSTKHLLRDALQSRPGQIWRNLQEMLSTSGTARSITMISIRMTKRIKMEAKSIHLPN